MPDNMSPEIPAKPPSKIVPLEPGKRVGGAEDLNFRRTEAEKHDKDVIDAEFVEEEDIPRGKKPPEPPPPPKPPTTGSEKPAGSEKSKFNPSWLVDSDEEFQKLRKGDLGTVGKKIAMLHETGIANTLGVDQLSTRAANWGEEAVEEGDEVWSELTPFLTRMAKKIETINEEQKTSAGKRGTLSRTEELLEAQVDYQRQQVELMKKGYKGFIQGIVKRLHVNPEQYDQALPPWFEELSANEQQMLTNLLHINYLAAIKRDTGMQTLDNWANPGGLRIEDEALAEMAKNMPGFRFALATFVKDIFEEGRGYDHLVISGTPATKDPATGARIEPTKGYAIVGSERRLNAYRKDLTGKLATIFAEAYGNKLADAYRVSNEDLASIAVASVDNLLFGGGAYDSGDEERAITPGDANVYSEQVRTLFMPGIKGKKSKWLVVRGTKAPGVAEEDFGGIIGAWIRQNAAINRGGFRDQLEAGNVRLIPDRLFYSMFDHESFSKESASPYAGKTLAQALIWSGKKEIAPGVYDFENGEDEIPFIDLSYELLGDYADTRSAAIKIFKHITGGKQEDLLNTDGLINALIKARKDPLINEIFRDEDLVTACVINTANPPGLVRGISETLLNIPEMLYDSDVYNLLLDDRLFDGMEPGFRARLIARLHANDLAGKPTLKSVLRGVFPSTASSVLVSDRARLREKARMNLNEGR